jgi:hypothetical protein
VAIFKRFFRFIIALLILLSIPGCLTCEKKEYVFHLTGKNSGKLTIMYVNIFSSLIDSTGEVNVDFEELTEMWLNGKKLEIDFPQVKKIRKRLFEENGTLCGEVTMEFDDLSKVGLSRNTIQKTYMFNLSNVKDDGENFAQTNGDFGGEITPVISWPEDIRTLRFSTKITTPDSSCVSMLKMWKEKQK